MRFTYNAPTIFTFVLLSLLILGIDTISGGIFSSQYLVASATPSIWTGSIAHILSDICGAIFGLLAPKRAFTRV